MNRALVVLALALVACVVAEKAANNQDIIRLVNSDPHSTWVAGSNDRLEGLSTKDFSKLLGVNGPKSKLAHKPASSSSIIAGIPASFDSRTNWPGCIGAILDQGHCGSCWAFGAVESLMDRFCIQSHGKVNVSLSEQMLVSCDTTDGGCDGGQPENAWNFLMGTGTVTSACYPYDMGTCQHPGCSEWNTPSCNSTCQNGAAFSTCTYKAKSAYTVDSTVTAIQTEIMTNGPVEVVFAVYEDFATYKSGVYIHKSGDFLGLHAVKNIGWGTLNGVDYWLIQNSWNTNWGDQGYFMIRRGTDECGIEDSPTAGLAAV